MTNSRRLEIINIKGLHARASARFVEVVEAHDADATVTFDGMKTGGDSIMGLLMLAAAKGAVIEVSTQGPDADVLLERLAALIDDKFGEGE